MPMRQEIQYLRESARRMREIAAVDTPISSQLRKMAAELKTRAAKLEKDRQFTDEPPPE